MLRLLVVAVICYTATSLEISIIYKNGNYSHVPGIVPSAAAWGSYNRTMNTTGWSSLKVHTNPHFTDEVQAYAAGLAEGILTQEDIYVIFQNYYDVFASIPFINLVFDDIQKWFLKNYDWVNSQVKSNKTTLWEQAALSIRQQDGMMDGYHIVAPSSQKLEKGKLLTIAGASDLEDVVTALLFHKGLPLPQWNLTWSHCTTLHHISPKKDEVYFAHTTWSMYATMLRIYKIYELNYHSAEANSVTFSSYPGTLMSIDDFYITSTNLSVVETTNSVIDPLLYKSLTTDCLITWQRIGISNRLSKDAATWVHYFAQYISGTYNNQWMVLDLNKFTPGQDLPPSSFWILESWPVGYEAGDMTSNLNKAGYWASYNVPYFKKVFDKLGYPLAIELYGPEMYSHSDCKRAQLLANYHTQVTSLETFKQVMRSNEYETSPIGDHNPFWAISSRGDLSPYHKGQYKAACFGGTDTKLSTYSEWTRNKNVYAQSGPTRGRDNVLAPFSFSKSKVNCTAHYGMPDTFDFGWEVFRM